MLFFFFPVEITLFQYAGYSSSVPAPGPFLLYTLTFGPRDWPEDPFDTCLLAEFGQWDAKVQHLSTREERGQGVSLRALASFTHTSAAGAGSLTRVFLSSSGPALTGFITQLLLLSSLNFIWNLYFHVSWSVFLYIYSY